MMKDGIIELDSEAGKELGFTSDKFIDGSRSQIGSYLWKKEGYIFISFIQSKENRKSHLSKLFDAILSKGYGIKVPIPSALMEAILRKKGFERTEEHSEQHGNVEVWVKEKTK